MLPYIFEINLSCVIYIYNITTNYILLKKNINALKYYDMYQQYYIQIIILY